MHHPLQRLHDRIVSPAVSLAPLASSSIRVRALARPKRFELLTPRFASAAVAGVRSASIIPRPNAVELSNNISQKGLAFGRKQAKPAMRELVNRKVDMIVDAGGPAKPVTKS